MASRDHRSRLFGKCCYPYIVSSSRLLSMENDTPPPTTTDFPPSPPVVYQPRLHRLLWIFAILVIAVVAPYLAEQVQYSITRGRLRAEAEVARTKLADLPDGASTFSLVAKALEPSVVGVKTTRVVDDGKGDELSFLFGRIPRYRSQGQGSGVIVDASGYVITNFHVIENATEVVVELSDGRTIRDVEVMGADPLSDVAVLKIDAGALIAAPWGDSDKLDVGDPVLAIGSPFGLASTVTAGIVSAKGRRRIVENLDYQDFLQTDAAVNPGNSGGPLVNLKGEVVGINTAIVGHAYQGISFAIPSDLAHEVYERLKTTGKVARGWLGVSLQTLDDRLIERFGLDTTDGALVAGVFPNSPAADAGIEPGDVIVEWNGEKITDPGELGLAVASTKIGSTAKVVLIRNGAEVTKEVDVVERPVQMEQLRR